MSEITVALSCAVKCGVVLCREVKWRVVNQSLCCVETRSAAGRCVLPLGGVTGRLLDPESVGDLFQHSNQPRRVSNVAPMNIIRRHPKMVIGNLADFSNQFAGGGDVFYEVLKCCFVFHFFGLVGVARGDRRKILNPARLATIIFQKIHFS